MRAEGLGVALLVVGGVVTAAAIAATTSLDTASELAVSGTALAAAGLALLVAPSVRHRSAPVPDPVGSPLVQLRESFRSGPLGRQALIASVVSLEHRAADGSFGRLSPDEERRLVASPPETFRAWLDARLDALESDT
jgi:hypothetical protein